MEKVVKRKRRPRIKLFTFKQTLLAFFLSLIVIATYMFISVMTNMNPVALEMAKAKVLELTTIALNDVIREQVLASKFQDVLDIQVLGDNAYIVTADTNQMNSLSAAIAKNAQERIAEFGEEGVGVPWGTLTNITFLSGVGPDIYFRFTPVGGVTSNYRSEIKTSGINQSLYRVNINLTAYISIILPNTHAEISVTASAAVAESVIVGEVPQVYTNVASEEDMLNLIPNEVPEIP
ncbi:MAG: sporulation protein YunB [Clostridia bacterium]|nr:sporulation protein YunB [Clostridia bacterium]